MEVERFPKCNSKLTGNIVEYNPTNPALGTATSHIRNIRKWLRDTDDEFAVFCEDDLSLDTVSLWNFTWQEFMNILPLNWGIVQLCVIRTDDFNFGLTELWTSNSWGQNCYLIKRDFAEELIDRVSLSCEDSFNFHLEELEYNQQHTPGIPEDIIYHQNGSGTSRLKRSYACPMFIETMVDSVVRTGGDNTKVHRKSHFRTLEILSNNHNLGMISHGHE